MASKTPHHRKRLGQIFLRDPLVVDKILQSAALTPQETVVEIGPGRGILTAALARHTHALRAGMHSFALPLPPLEVTVSLLWHPRQDNDPAHRLDRVAARP